MTESRPSQKALEKIMRGEVKQRSRWYFFFQNVALWILGTVSVFAGTFIVSLMIFTAANCDMEIHREIYGQILPPTTVFLIILWVLITGGLIILSDVSLRRTKRGYVYPLWLILIVDIILSVIFGSIFYFVGIGAYMDDMIASHTSYYHNVEKRRAALFNKPEKGILMGKVYYIGEDYVKVATENTGGWIVFVSEIDENMVSDLQEGSDIIFAGSIEDGNVFVACDAKIPGIRGMHRELQKKHIDVIKEEYKEQKEFLRETLEDSRINNPCSETVRWRIQIQQ